MQTVSTATARVPSPVGEPPLRCWCDHGDYAVAFRTPRFGLLRCRHCGCFQVNPPALREDSASGAFYDSYYQGDASHLPDAAPSSTPTRLSRFWRVVERVPELRGIGHSVLDIGCGDGQLCAELVAHGWPEVIGLDVAPARVERAAARCPSARFHAGTLDSTDVPRRSLDLLIMDNVIEHLPEPLSFVGNLRPWLKPGGRIVLITPNMESGNFRLLGRRWTPELAPHVHLFLFTPRSLARLLDRAGFAVESTGVFPVNSGYWRTSLSSLTRGHLREAGWRAIQGAGELYGRITGDGAMAYAVAHAV
ncbi:MAG TPA: class I SAM-dependent methyltransferase [Vicinamibacterales bacterium]